MDIKRSDKQIDAVLNKCDEQEESGENPWPGQTYAEGVKNGILWITGQYSDNPMDE